MVIVFTFVLVTLSTGMYARVIVNLTERQYSERAENLAATAAGFIDVETVAALRGKVEKVYNSVENKVFSERWGEDDWNEYIAAFDGIDENEDFLSLRETLRKFQDTSDADCLYISYLEPVIVGMVYLVDSAYEDACPPGCLDHVFDVNREVLTDPSRGFPAYMTDTEEYGKLISAGVPIYYDGKVIAFLFVDYSLEAIHNEQATSVWKLYAYLVSTSVLICIVALLVIKRTIITPIKLLTEASRCFAETTSDSKVGVFSNLKIKTGDELQELSESMKNMEVQINGNIKELVEMNKRLVASQNMASEMSELANKDALTGVGNKMAYERYTAKIDECLQNGNITEFGIAMFDLNSLKTINDTLGHNSGDAAIIRLSNVISKIFVHSPVFRIGGDEFTVILQNDDYKNAKQLMEQFRSIMGIIHADATASDADITSASGYAEFNGTTDKCYIDVFNRADNEMYRNKSEMKKTDR